jgi:hypothetical protein
MSLHEPFEFLYSSTKENINDHRILIAFAITSIAKVCNSNLLCWQCQHPQHTSDLHLQTMADKSLSSAHIIQRSCFCMFRPTLGPTHLSVKQVPGLILGCKGTGAWFWLPTPSGVKFEEKLELYLYSLCPVLGWTLPFTILFFIKTIPEHISEFKWSKKIILQHLCFEFTKPVSKLHTKFS